MNARIVSWLLFGCCFLSLEVARAQSTQNLVLEKVYMKWLVDSSANLKNPRTFCWHLRDLVLESEKLPSLRVNTSGPRIEVVVDLQKTDASCRLTKDEGPGWTLRSQTNESLQLVLDAKLPFSRFALEDSRGRKIELLVESRFAELEESGFMNYFKDSVFSLRVAAIQNTNWQIPFLLTKYELPTLWKGRLALQIALGQSLFDFAGNGLRQGRYELGLATPILGSRLPFDSRYSVRLRTLVDGVQINDQNELGTYPLKASQMWGFGSEGFLKMTPEWGLQLSTTYYLSRIANANLMKLGSEGVVSYALSERWRLEAGLKYEKQNINNLLSAEKSGYQEYAYFIGLNVKPYLEKRH